MKRKGPGLLAGLGMALVTAAVPVSVKAQDDLRIQQLEKALQELNQDIQALKEQADAEKEKAAAAQQKLDSQVPTVTWREGVTFSDPRGNWSLRLFGRGQLDYRQFDPSAAANTFSVRRARLGASIGFLKDYGLTVEGEYATGSASGTTAHGSSITNAFIDFNWITQARIRVGQFKPQFGLENTASANFSDFQERGLTQNLIQNLNYDRGIMVHGAPFTGVNYGFTVSNGTGLNLDERQLSRQDVDADGKMVTGRLTANLAQIVGLPDTIIHLGGSYKTGKVANSQANPFTAATGLTEARGVTFFNPEPFASPTVAGSNIDRTLSATELALAYRSWKLQAEYWQAQYEGERTTAPVTAYDPRINAAYLSVLWLVTGEHYPDTYSNGIFARIRPRSNFSTGPDGGRGAWEVGVRYSWFDANDFSAVGTGVPNTGRVSTTGTGATASTPARQAEAWTVGVKWLPNAYTRLMLNYIVTAFDTPIVANDYSLDEEKSITLRAQVDF